MSLRKHCAFSCEMCARFPCLECGDQNLPASSIRETASIAILAIQGRLGHKLVAVRLDCATPSVCTVFDGLVRKPKVRALQMSSQQSQWWLPRTYPFRSHAAVVVHVAPP